MQLQQSLNEFGVIVPAQRALARRWLQLGVLSLGLAGVFAVLLVLSRTPGSEAFFPWLDFFHTALVVHVDQSVLIWFLSMAGLTGSLLIAPSGLLRPWQWLAFALALTGTLGIALSAFVGEGAPLMNNYVPVLQRPLFFFMLGLFGSGIALQAVLTLFSGPALFARGWRSPPLPLLAGVTVSLAVLLSLSALLIAWWQIPAEVEVEGQGFYEYLFWGGGHTLQFAPIPS